MMIMNQKGSALILAILVTVVLLILSGSYVSMMDSERRMTSMSEDSTAAINIAEAGAEAAIWEILHSGMDYQTSEGWTGSSTKTKTATLQDPGGTAVGDYTVTVTNPSGPTPIVLATGFVPNQTSPLAQRTVRILLDNGSLLTNAVFGIESVQLDSNAETDSYDSRDGPYDEDTAGSEGDVGTNATAAGSINLDSNATVNGDAAAGPGADPNTAITLGSNAEVTGQQTAASSPVTPISMVPPALPPQPAISLGGSDTMTISTGGQYPSITLDSNSELIIDNSLTLHVTGGLELDSNSDITITNGADVEIYIDGWLVLDSNTSVNNQSQDPTKLSIFGTDNMTTQPGGDPAIEYNSNSTFYGLIYAPTAAIDLDSNSEVFGAVFGKDINMDSNAEVHYDEALANLSGFGSGLAVASWQEK